MRFGDPGWFAAGLLACLVLIWMWHRHDARQHAALARFVSAHLRRRLTRSVSVARRRAQRGLYLAAVASLFVALAGPLVGYRWEQISRRGNEIVFAIDTSRSMSTPDVNPDRLTRAKLAIDDFASHLQGDAAGIVAFAGRAFLVCPITLDYGAFHESLSAIDTNTISRGGTNISRAIQEAQAALHRRPGSDKILILVTDGEDLEGSALSAAQAAAHQDGLKIYTVGVGTAAGDLIPIPPDQGGGFVKDDSGAFVKSHLDEAALKAIAAATGGVYVPLGAQGEGMETIFRTVFGSIAKHDIAYRQRKIYIDRYQWPLAGALGLLLASMLIGTRRRSGARQPAARTVMAVSVASLVLLAELPTDPSRAASVNAEDAYKKGDFTAAEQAYAAAARRDPKKPVLQFNTGTAAYRAGQFAQAAQAFRQSINRAPSSDPKRLANQEDAYYNLGNALYRTGQKTEQANPQETLQRWGEAVKAYETALQLRADDADSKYNRDLVKRRIEALRQQQNQQPNNGSGQQPPPNGGGSKADQPPRSAAQSPPASAPPPAPAAGDPHSKSQPGGSPDQRADDDARSADNQHLPGQMSREEARELLDSAKGDERHPLTVPLARRDDEPPEKPYKNW
ncbi:MAG: vWA domain-containing protein [Steroidobacteraceae bacterium]